MFCELNGEGRDPAGAALDQDGLALFQFQRVLDGADRGQAGQCKGRGIDMRQGSRFLRDDGGLDRDLLGIGAFLPDVADREYLVADAKVGDAFADGRNHAGEIAAENIGKARQLPRFAVAHLPVRAVDARRDDVDHDLAGHSDRVRHVAVFENVGSAVPFDVGCFHLCPVLNL